MASSFANRPDSPADLVRSYLASFDTRDPAIIAQHVSDDFINEHTAALGQGCRGRSIYQERLLGFLADMVGLHYEIESMVEQDGRVMVSYVMTAQWQGDAPISIRGAQRLEVIGGQIVRRIDYWDSAAFLLQAVPEAREHLTQLGLQLPADPSS
jgi:ketosteroid isomerase-like protein